MGAGVIRLLEENGELIARRAGRRDRRSPRYAPATARKDRGIDLAPYRLGRRHDRARRARRCRRGGRTGRRLGRAGPGAGAQGAGRRQAPGHRQQGDDRASRHGTRRAGRGQCARRSSSKPRSPAGSRWSRGWAKAPRPTGSSGSTASSTAPAITSSARWKRPAPISPTCSPRRRRWAMPRPTRPSISRASTPRTSWRSSPPSRSAPRSISAAWTFRGITKIRAADIAQADALGYVIRLIGLADCEEDGGRAACSSASSPISSPRTIRSRAVDGPTNAVVIEGNFVGRLLFEGAGAGDGPTASAVVADIVDIARGNRGAPFSLPVATLAALRARRSGPSPQPLLSALRGRRPARRAGRDHRRDARWRGVDREHDPARPAA